MNKQEIEKAIEFFTKRVSLYNHALEFVSDGKQRNNIKDEIESCDLAISALQQQLNNGWIPVSERLPENDIPVIITARRKEGARGYFIYKACYNAPHTHSTEDWGCDTEYIDTEYDEENDCFWVPECWYEDNAIADNGNYIIDDEFDVIAWQPLPEPYQEVSE
jgi:hypothetical protein